MLGDTSEFGPIDLLGGIAVNMGATKFALAKPDLRVGIALGKDKKVQPYSDFRFLGGVAAALAGQFGPPMVRRAGHDLANGLLNSFVATEMVAAKAKELCAPDGFYVGRASAPAQIAESAESEKLAGEYANELLNQVVRVRVGESTAQIREYYMAKAFFADSNQTSIDALLAELDAEELEEDPLEISVPWEDPSNG